MRLGISDDVSGMYITISTRVAEDQENAELNFSCDECTARTAVGKGGKKSLLCDAGSELRLGRELEWNHEDNKIGWDKKKKKSSHLAATAACLEEPFPVLAVAVASFNIGAIAHMMYRRDSWFRIAI